MTTSCPSRRAGVALMACGNQRERWRSQRRKKQWEGWSGAAGRVALWGAGPMAFVRNMIELSLRSRAASTMLRSMPIKSNTGTPSRLHLTHKWTAA